MVHVILVAGFRGLFDGFLGLALAADEEDLLVLAGEIAEEVSGLVDLIDGLLDVEDVDVVAGAHDEFFHLGVPALGLVSKVDASFDEFGEYGG
jgi:hypothetical protein